MPHRSSFRGRGRGGISDAQRRKKSWVQVTGPAVASDGSVGVVQTPQMNIDVPAGPAAAPSASSAGLFSDPTLDKVPEESTILRIRGSVNLPKNTIGTAFVENFAVGIGVMEATAAALGAFPNPASPAGGAWDGWMFYRSIQATALDANATVIDVKAMRKVQSGMAIIIVVGAYVAHTGANTSASTAFQLQINLRALILLP